MRRPRTRAAIIAVTAMVSTRSLDRLPASRSVSSLTFANSLRRWMIRWILSSEERECEKRRRNNSRMKLSSRKYLVICCSGCLTKEEARAWRVILKRRPAWSGHLQVMRNEEQRRTRKRDKQEARQLAEQSADRSSVT